MTIDVALEKAHELARAAAISRFASEELDIQVYEDLPSGGAIYRTWPDGEYWYVRVTVNHPMRIDGTAHLYVLDRKTNAVIASTALAYG